MGFAAETRFGPYQITAKIGEGGMGEVFAARDLNLNRDVAIKFLLPSVADNPERLLRFRREAQVLASLNHTNIAHIYGLEDHQTRSFLVMEFVDGEDLAHRIVRGALPLDDALAIARQLAEALEAAHEQGVIHRDLKPGNIKVRADGTVKVLDFGLAKALERSTDSAQNPSLLSVTQSPTITSPAMTAVGIILGTAAYMSPEQAKGRPLDRRSDMWAFGCVLYEMLTGKRAFGGEDVSETLAYVLTKEVDWSALPPDTPAVIRKLLRRCLEKDRKDRQADAADARLDIQEVLSPVGSQGKDSGDPRQAAGRSTVPWTITAIFAVALLVVLTMWAPWRKLQGDAGSFVRFAIPLGEGQEFTQTNDQAVAISPEGARLAYVANRQLYLRPLSEQTGHPISGTDLGTAIRFPVFSADGQFITFGAGTATVSLKRISVTGGVAVTLCNVEQPFGLSQAANGILFAVSKGIMRVSEAGGEPELVVAAKDRERMYGPQMLPDGQTVLFTTRSDIPPGATSSIWDNASIVVQSVKSGERKTILSGGSDARYVASGHLLYAVQGVVFAAPFDVARLTVTGKAVPVIEGVGRADSGINATTQFSVSDTGTLVFLSGPAAGRRRGSDLAWMDRDGRVEFLNLPPASYAMPRVSPDGRRIAVGTDDGTSADVWVVEIGASEAPRRLTFAGRNRFPVWGSDGRRVAFQSDREGDSAIFVEDIGSGAVERVTKPEGGAVHQPNSWSPDGKYLLYSVIKGDRASLWTYDFFSRTSSRFADVESNQPPNAVFSPDGHWVTYVLGLPNRNVFVRTFPANGNTYQISRTEVGGSNPYWSPDGRELFYGRGPGDYVAVRVTTEPGFSISNPIPIAAGPAGRQTSGTQREYDIARDGKRFLIVLPAGQQLTKDIQVGLNWFSELRRLAPPSR